MFSRFLSLLPIAAFVAVATAAPNALEARQVSQCNGGTITCCNQSLAANSQFNLFGPLGGVLSVIPLVNVPVGLTCDPITVIGVGNGAQCTSQQVCCTGNSFNGVVNVGCTPINVGL